MRALNVENSVDRSAHGSLKRGYSARFSGARFVRVAV